MAGPIGSSQYMYSAGAGGFLMIYAPKEKHDDISKALTVPKILYFTVFKGSNFK